MMTRSRTRSAARAAALGVDSQFLRIVSDMSLNQIETAALRLCVARNDIHVRAALEVFRLENDADDLKDTLRRIARRMIEQTTSQVEASERIAAGVEDDDDDDDKDYEDNEDEDEDEDDEDDDDDDDDDDEEEDDEEDDEAGPQGDGELARRRHVIHTLLSQLMENETLSEGEARAVLKMFLTKDDVLSAALDVFEMDNDVDELKDTIVRLGKLSS